MKEPPSEERGESQHLEDGLRQRIEGLIPEIVRRMFYAGVGAVFTTEEGWRKLANEFSLPKDVARYIVQQAQSTKAELFRMVAGEVRGFLEGLNITEELQRVLTSLSFEIKTEIRLIPNDAQLVRPKVKNKVTIKRKSAAASEEVKLEEVKVSAPSEEPPPAPESSESESPSPSESTSEEG